MSLALLPFHSPGSLRDLERQPTSSITEASLLHGYRRVGGPPRMVVLEQRPCGCGGQVTADPTVPAEGVTLHNDSAGHEAWAIANGWRHG